MLLLIALLGVSLVVGYDEHYEGFNDCGYDGWSCSNAVKDKYEITYKCDGSRPNARIWIWTARLPTGFSILTVRDCNHVEVHFDCTKGLRSTLLKQFNVINVTTLDILPPLLPGVFLHDNDQVPQAPPNFNIVDVKHIKFYPGVFDRPTGACRYKFVELESMSLENVHITKFMVDLFHNQNMNVFVMKNVVIDEIDRNALTIAANTTIMGTTFPNIRGNAINLRGEEITFVNNTFKKIETLGLTIKSTAFTFSQNHVEEIETQGLDVLGARIKLTNNTFHHLEMGAFQKISPGYSPLAYQMASKFIYNFSNNIIHNINPGSMHLNWEVYKKVCSDIIFKNNLFNCSCINVGWMSVYNGLGPKITKVKEFYDVYLNKGDNRCNGHNHCPLTVVIDRIQDVCSKKTNISTICSSFDSMIDVEATTIHDDNPVPLSYSVQQNSEAQEIVTDVTQRLEKEIPVPTYAENQTSELKTRGFPVLFVVVPVIVLVTAISLGMFIWWYKKNKQRQTVTTIYKNNKGADVDNLIVVNELHNEVYEKP